MTRTPNLNLPHILPAQAQKHITHNEALNDLDKFVHLTVNSAQTTTPPMGSLPNFGFIIPPDATGTWANKTGQIAWSLRNEDWTIMVPKPGWTCFVLDEGRHVVFHDDQWQPLNAQNETVGKFGINASADMLNRFAVKSETVLFDHEDQNHILKINKATEASVGAVQFQTAYQSFGEIGLVGQNALSMRTSSDGQVWQDALSIDKDTAHTQCRNLFSGEIFILNDNVKSIVPPKTGGFMMILVDHPVYPQLSHAAIIAYDVGISPNILSVGGGDKISLIQNEALSGTTGAEGHTTLSAIEGSLIVENRYGIHQTYRYTFFG